MSVERIVETLRQLNAIHRNLLEAEREKTAVIVRNDVERLNAIVQQERSWARQTEELETQRIQETRSYLAGLGLHEENGHIDQLIRSVNNFSQKQALIAVREELSGVLRELQRINEQNRQLASQALEFVDFSIGLLVEDPGEGMVYKHPMNQANTRAGSGLFNSRI